VNSAANEKVSSTHVLFAAEKVSEITGLFCRILSLLYGSFAKVSSTHVSFAAEFTE